MTSYICIRCIVQTSKERALNDVSPTINVIDRVLIACNFFTRFTGEKPASSERQAMTLALKL